jgi:hypothetical protein
MSEQVVMKNKNEEQSLSVEELAAVAAYLVQKEKVSQNPQQNTNQGLSAWQTAAWLGQMRGGC